MSLEVISLGEILIEIMHKDLDEPHNLPGTYGGPYPSRAPAIFIDAAANLGLSSGFIGVVGDEFGDLLLNRLKKEGGTLNMFELQKDTQQNFLLKNYLYCFVFFS